MDSGAISEYTPTDLTPLVPNNAAKTHDSYAALRFRDFRLLAAGRLIFTLGEQTVNVAIGYFNWPQSLAQRWVASSSHGAVAVRHWCTFWMLWRFCFPSPC